MDTYRPTIGIECHVQLKTKTKLFSGADNDARDKEPNTVVSPICFGLPGVLPVLNREAVMLAIKAGVALGADIPRVSRFERKHYFYPDLPKGYQITQLGEPTIGPGRVTIYLDNGEQKEIRIHHAHLEEDAGKLTHPIGVDYSLVDLNRAGTPLIEIVSEADIKSPAEARAYALALYQLMTYAGVTAGDLYHGNMRFDVNLSVAEVDAPLGTRTETKNLNSFRAVEKAAEYEWRRQAELRAKGQRITQETRGWDEAKQKTFSQRSKENAHDYRYFPDADLPPVIIREGDVEEIRTSMPKLPPQYREEWRELGVDGSVIEKLLAHRPFAELVSAMLEHSMGGIDAARRIANWCASTADPLAMPEFISSRVESFASLASMAAKGAVNSGGAKELFKIIMSEGGDPMIEADKRQLLQVNNESMLEQLVDAVLSDAASAKAIADIKAGQEKAIGYLVGQCMKLAKGQANPATIQTIIKGKLHDNENAN